MEVQSVRLEGADILEGLWFHRMLTTRQIHELFLPTRTERWAQKQLEELSGWGLIDFVRAREKGGAHLWFLTESGGRAVAGVSDNVTGLAPAVEQVASVLQAHTRALNEVGVSFVRTARGMGDDCLPLAWEHEVIHRMGGNQTGQVFRCDALLRYGLVGNKRASQRHYFIELDRGTETMDQLVDKLRRYAEYRTWVEPDTEPGTVPGGMEAWRRRYPAFPRLLFVFAPSRQVEGAKRLRNRAFRVLNMVAADPIVRHTLQKQEDFHVSACLLEDLQRHGAYAPIFLEVGTRRDRDDGMVDFFVREEPVNIVGEDEKLLKAGSQQKIIDGDGPL